MPKKSKFEFKVHFVKHQVFYTPVYMCGQDYVMSFVNEPYMQSDARLVKQLFNDSVSKDGVIDIYLTGGPDVVSFLRNNPDMDQNKKIYFWLPLVDRLPLPLIKSKSGAHADYSMRDIVKSENIDTVISPPQDTTLHYFSSKFYDSDAFIYKYMNDGLSEEENRRIREDLEQTATLFKGRLRPQPDFESITHTFKENPEAIAFLLSEDPDIRKFKKINPPMDVIVFTCIYTKEDIWDDRDKRNALIEFCRSVSLNINNIHDFHKFYKKTGEDYLNNELLSSMLIFYNKKIAADLTQDERNGFIRSLKYLAQHRIFAVNLLTDLQLKSENLLAAADKEIKDIYYKYRLYYWMSKGIVVNVPKAIDDQHEREQSQMQFLESISASTHMLKTTINTLLSYPLNTLKEMMEDEECIDLLIEAKETLLINAELINLISKLSTKSYSDETRREALIDSKLYSTDYTSIDLTEIIENQLEIVRKDPTLHVNEIELVSTNRIIIPPSFLSFQKLHPTPRFFKMIVLTIIENCRAYGKAVNEKIALTVTFNDHELTFKNPTTHHFNSKDAITGNWRVVDTLLRQLKIGRVKLSSPPPSKEFLTVISAQYYGKD